METVTINKLNKFDSISNAIQWARLQYDQVPKRPNKPILYHENTSIAAKQYAIDLEKWEGLMLEYNALKSEINKYNNIINLIIVQFIKEQSGLFTLPVQYQEKVYA